MVLIGDKLHRREGNIKLPLAFFSFDKLNHALNMHWFQGYLKVHLVNLRQLPARCSYGYDPHLAYWVGASLSNISKRNPIFVDNMHIFHQMFCFFILGEILQNFDLKNMISTYSKDFPWKKKAKICQIYKEKGFQST
jgi:hypothetical protein